MRSTPYIRTALKYATLTIAVVIVCIIGLALTQKVGVGSLQGRLVTPQESGVIPTVRFSADRNRDGYLAPADTHVLFEIRSRIPRVAFMGGSAVDAAVRSWIYCFDGSESQNKALGKRGKELYTGNFGYSLAERKAQLLRPKSPDNDIVGILNDTKLPEKKPLASIQEILNPGLCYAMIDGESAAKAGFGGGIPFGEDVDGDGLNSGMETKYGTDPNNPDSDRDGLPDGIEVFVATTNPREIDTDHDGLADGCEDKNRNGVMDTHETSPLAADSDRDGLCDGNGWAAGCPELKAPYCHQDAENNRVCEMRPASAVFGEDMNSNCTFDKPDTDAANPQTYGIPDYDYKWNQFVAKNKFRPSGQGIDAPEFPVPGLPVDLND